MKEANTYTFFRDLTDGCESVYNRQHFFMHKLMCALYYYFRYNFLRRGIILFTSATRIPIGCAATLKFSQDTYYPSVSTCALQLVSTILMDHCSFASKTHVVLECVDI